MIGLSEAEVQAMVLDAVADELEANGPDYPKPDVLRDAAEQIRVLIAERAEIDRALYRRGQPTVDEILGAAT